MDWLFIGQALACGFAMGFLISFSGVGGGVLVIPALSLFFGLPISAAIGTASAYTALTKVFAAAEHWRRGHIHFGLFWRFLAGAAPGAILTAAAINLTLHWQPQYREIVQGSLKVLVIAAIIAAIFFMFFVKGKGNDKSGGGGKTSRTTTASGFGIGMIMGATGIGGGVLIVPALLAGGELPKRVVGTSIIIALALSALSALVYAGGGQVRFDLMLWMLAGSVFAVPVGGYVLHRSSEVFVRHALVVVVSAALVMMLIG
ncbi:MAG: sulfite exporter TauE/SafE family protein [Gammaproteobacteria bacterium]